MKKITEIAHDLLLVKQKDCAIDFTCGNGFDTKFLATHFKEVYAFDIQEQAILNSKILCDGLDHIHFILDSHKNVKKYVNKIDAGIFNCGYLPHGDETITTNADEVIVALEEALSLLNKDGRIVVVLYPGFENGYKEAQLVEAYVSSLSGKQYNVAKFQIVNREKVPYILCIEKNRNS